MRRALLLSMLFVMALTFAGLGACQPQTTIFVDPATITVTPCEEFTVNITVANVVDLYAWEFKLSFNTTLIELINVEEGPFLRSVGPTWFMWYIEPDWHVFGCILLSGPGATGSGTLAILTFHCQGPGDTWIYIYETTMSDPQMVIIPHNTPDAIHVYQQPPEQDTVGGVWIPINKTALLAPWIGLASLITVAASIVYVKHRNKKQN